MAEKRKALIVGIDHYESLDPLRGCVNDAQSVYRVLSRHADGRTNFIQPKLLLAKDRSGPLDRDTLRDAIQALFAEKQEIALFYFAGHGYVDEGGGFLCTSEAKRGSDGIALADVMGFARQSKASNKIIILDSCHGGIIGNNRAKSGVTELDEGMTLLTASTENQYSYEGGNGAPGVFTNLMVDALDGAAANLVGDITPGSVYAHIDQSLGPWGVQRPVFKTNVESFVSLRRAKPPIALDELQQIATIFPTPDFQLKLDPSYEPERSKEDTANEKIPPPDPEKNRLFKVLQNLVKVNLVRPVGADHMWHAAMFSHSCELTVLGKHYRRLVADELI